MAAYWRVFAAAADTAVSATTDATYSVPRNSTLATNVSVSTAVVGQRWTGTVYGIGQYFPVFDTSSLPVDRLTGTISLSISTASGADAVNDQLEVRAVSSVANKIAGGGLDALTPLFGTNPFPTTAVDTRWNGALDLSSMARTSACSMVVHSRNERLNVPPTALAQVTFYTSEVSVSTRDPYLDATTGTPWSIVGIGTSVESTSTSITLIEPAGVAAGDLLVACFAGRGYASGTSWVTSPGGWELSPVLSTGSANTGTSATTALPSARMLWVVRGASPPSFIFGTNGTASVVIGRVVAYRGNAQATPLDASTMVVTPFSTTAVSVTGLTTTQDDDLIVAMTAGGQEATWSSFTNTTAPLIASDINFPVTTPPSPLMWIRRAEQVTTTGADTSLAIFDAVRTGAGATGNLTVTASIAAGHVVIAGAFKILPSVVSGDVTVNAVGVAAGSTIGAVTVSAVAPVSFEAVGVAAGTALGAAAAVGRANISTEALGAAAVSVLGAATASTVWNVSATSVGRTAGTALGAVTIAAAASTSTTPVGQTALSALGNVSVAAGGAVDVAPTSVTAAALSGAVTVTAKQAVSLAAGGVAALGATGTVTVSGQARTTPVGVTAAAALSPVTVDTVRVASVAVTGVSAGTASGGVSIAVGGGIDITPAAQHAVAVSGTVTVAAQQQVSTSVSSAAVVALSGTASVSIRSSVVASGAAAIAAVGTASITAKQAVTTSAAGVTASTVLGGVSVAAGGSVGVIAAGQAATASVGTASVTAKQVVSVSPTGVSAAMADGVVVASGKTNVTIAALGQQVMAAIGSVTVDAEGATTGLIGVWNGSAWVDKPVKVWTGVTWAPKPVKTWTGGAWV